MIKDEANIKAYINRYFSDELQYDETVTGAMERNQLKKWMLDWANPEDIKARQHRKLLNTLNS